MIKIEIRHMINGLVADLEITDRLSIVTGNSGTGKTHLCNMIQTSLEEDNGVLSITAYDTVMKKYTDVYFAQSVEMLEYYKTDGAVFICDEYKTGKRISAGDNNYVLIMDREAYSKGSLLDLVYTDGVYRLEPIKEEEQRD